MATDDDVQIKFRAPAYLRELIDQGVAKDNLRIPSANQWLINAVVEKLERQGISVAPPAPAKRR